MFSEVVFGDGFVLLLKWLWVVNYIGIVSMVVMLIYSMCWLRFLVMWCVWGVWVWLIRVGGIIGLIWVCFSSLFMFMLSRCVQLCSWLCMNIGVFSFCYCFFFRDLIIWIGMCRCELIFLRVSLVVLWVWCRWVLQLVVVLRVFIVWLLIIMY